jgi:hypothetical protein
LGRQRRDQGRLFYEFRLEDRIPENHLLRRMNVFVTAALAEALSLWSSTGSNASSPLINCCMQGRYARSSACR